MASACNLIKIGTGTQGDFKNIRVSNCVLKRPSPQALLRWDRLKKYGIEKGSLQGIAGIALEAVDGGSVDGVEVSGISMTCIQTPIFIRVDDRDNKNLLGKKSSIKNVKIDNITAVAESYITSSITALNGYVLENVAISNCAFRLKGCPVENADKNIVRAEEKISRKQNVRHYPSRIRVLRAQRRRREAFKHSRNILGHGNAPRSLCRKCKKFRR